MTYPSDRKNIAHFALKYLHWLSQSETVLECGPDSFAVLVAVVLAEDRIRYSRPPNFFNEQLCRASGIGSEPALIRARKRAELTGLLNYKAGAKRRPGVYFVDGFPNESLANAEGIRRESAGKAQPSNPIPFPVPNNSCPNESDDSEPPKKKPSSRKPPKTIEGFDQWYAIYPRKEKRGTAKEAFATALGDIQQTESVSRDEALGLLLKWTAERMPNLLSREQKFRPLPASWLNAESYRDELTSKRTSDDDDFTDFTGKGKRS